MAKKLQIYLSNALIITNISTQNNIFNDKINNFVKNSARKLSNFVEKGLTEFGSR